MDREGKISENKFDNVSSENITIPVIEEQITTRKEVVEKEKVRITKIVHEEQVPVSTPYLSEEVEVQHIPIDQYVDSSSLPQVRYEGNKIIIPVLKEVVVVEKKTVLVEELHITKHQVQKESNEDVSIRKEEILVERSPDPQGK